MTTDEFLRRQIIPLAYRQLPAAELFARAAAGDAEAFVALVCLKYPLVEGVCRQAIGPAAPVEDVALEAFVQLWRQRERVRDPAAVDGWLTRTAQNLAGKFVRSRVRERDANRAWCVGSASNSDPPDRAAIQAEIIRRVRLALSKQSDADQQLLWTAERSGGDAQAAESLGLSLSTYRVRLHRARQRLRALLTKYGVAPVAAAAAVVGGWRNRATSAVSARWATTAGRVQLIGVAVVCLAALVAAAVWAARPDEPAPTPDPALAAIAQAQTIQTPAVESLQARNLRIVQEIAPELRDITQRYYPADNQLKIVGVRAFGSEVEVEFEATKMPAFTAQAYRMRGRYCTWRRRLTIYAQPAGKDYWRILNPTRPAAVTILLPFGVFHEIVVGQSSFASAERLFERLPRDPRAQPEQLRFLFGPPGGELLLPAAGLGFAADAGRLFVVDQDRDIYVRDATGRWRFAGFCPGWWMVAHGDMLYCDLMGKIVTRRVDSTWAPWVEWVDFPTCGPGDRGFLAIAGDRFYAEIHPNVLCHRPLGDSKAAWVREESQTPIWPDGIAATAERLFAHDADYILSRPVRDASAPWTRVARIPDGRTWLAVDGDRLLAYGGPGPIYSRPLTAGPEVEWKIVGRAHVPPRYTEPAATESDAGKK